jgi:hypothetical protein
MKVLKHRSVICLPGRLWQPRNGRVENEDEEKLEGQRQPPAHGTTYKGEPVVYPVAQAEAPDVTYKLDDDKFSSPFDGRGFCLPNWCSCSVQAVADASRHSANEHLSQTVRRDLKNSSDAHNGGADEDGFSSTEFLSKPNGDDGSEKTTWEALVNLL